MAEIFRIDFIGSQTSFSAGKNVQARVILQLSESMKARSIDVHISGKAEVDWTEHERRGKVGKKSHSHRVPYSEETYLNQNIVLWALEDQEIPVGEHVFPFQFTIPSDCPPSFEGTLGHIRYTCSANIDRPCQLDTKVNVAFVVSPFVDLNTIDWVRSPAVQQIDDSIGSCCCKHGNIRAKVRLPKSGFVPGEEIPITVEIENVTSKQVKKVRAKLIENVKYKAQRQREYWGRTQHFGERDDSRTIAEMEKQFMVAPRSKRTFQGHLSIPPCTASFNNCEIIQLSYSMEVKIVTTSFFCGSVSARFHLQIGTIQHQQPQSPTVQPQSKMGDSDDCTEQTRLWIEKLSKERVCRPVETLPLNEPIYEDKVRFVCISDTHERLGEILDQIPNGDVLLHCGDFTNVGRRSAIINFNNQMGRLPHRHKIVIPGNHELGFDPISPIPSRLADAGYGTPNGHELLTNVTYLRDSSTKVFGFTVYGSPWQSHKGLAFYRGRGEPIRQEWEKIPAALKIETTTGRSSSSSNEKWMPQVDVLMTHSPPLGHNDWEDWGDPNKFRHLGCRDLLDFVEDRIRPKVHVFGHIHQRNGATTNGRTLFINASICDNDGKVCAQPRIFDLPLPEGCTKKGG